MPPILRVFVELPLQNTTIPLTIHSNELPEEAAQRFAEEFNLDASATHQLALHIKKSIANSTPRVLATNSSVNNTPTNSNQTSRGRGGKLFTPTRNQTAPKPRTVSRPPVNPREISNRLYQEAAFSREKKELIIKNEEYRKSLKEMEEVTFKPKISETSKKLADSLVITSSRSRSASKIQQMKIEAEQKALDECTFKPIISENSSNFIHVRSTNIFDSLYQDNKRSSISSPVQQPIIVNKTKEPSKTMSPTVWNRLYSTNSKPPTPCYPSNDLDSLPTSRSVTSPKSVRSHSSSSRAAASLYEAAIQQRLLRQKRDEEEELFRKKQAEFRPNEKSQAILAATKFKRYKELFDSVTNGEELLKPGNYDISRIQIVDYLDLLQPIFEFVEETQQSVDFEQFCKALDLRLTQAKGPTAHLFSLSSNNRPTAEDLEKCTFKPTICPTSAKMAIRREKRNVFESLYAYKDIAETRLQQIRDAKAEQALKGCTFHPLINKRP
jgi:hypothetical protein